MTVSSQPMFINNTKTPAALFSKQFITHHPKSGLNPLTDAAAYLFSIIGKLKQLKSYRHLNKLQKDLIHEVNQFQETAKARGYSSEYVLVSRYAICATIDDVLANTFWGSQNQWDNYNLLTVFNQESLNQDRFFTILERIIKDPNQYIDLMELMYICLSLGFKGKYRSTEFGNTQLEQITHALYKRIRAHHGILNKALAPFPIKTSSAFRHSSSPASLWSIALITTLTIFIFFITLGYLLDTVSNQAYKELVSIGKSLYEIT